MLITSFVFVGLGQLVDHLFVHMARSIKVNRAGVQKIKRNILALQQSLRSVAQEDVDRSMTYWGLYERGPKVRGICD
jgi:exocyst complex component 4